MALIAPGADCTGLGVGTFENVMGKLYEFGLRKGLPCYPREAIPERQRGVWVLGIRMGLEEDRRLRRSMLCKSTFRALEIGSHLSRSPGP